MKQIESVLKCKTFLLLSFMCATHLSACVGVCVVVGTFLVDGDGGKQELPFIIQILCNIVHIE